MFTCCIKYVVNLNKIQEFEAYAHAWITLVEKYGGTHHGYFLPGQKLDDLPNSTFSFPNIETYAAYKNDVAKDPECEAITKRCKATKCFSSYERSFLKPIFK